MEHAKKYGLKPVLIFVTFWCFLLLAMTVQAAVVATATSPGSNPDGSKDVITLYSEQGSICPPNSKRAVYYVGARKENVEGCYVVVDNKVHVGFVDGDSGVLPLSIFVFVGNAPQSAPRSGAERSTNDRPGVGPGKDTNGTPRPEMPIIAIRGPFKGPIGWM